MNEWTTVITDDGKIAPGRRGRPARAPRPRAARLLQGPGERAATFVEIDGVRWALPGDMATIDADGTFTCSAAGRCASTPAARRSTRRRSRRSLKSASRRLRRASSSACPTSARASGSSRSSQPGRERRSTSTRCRSTAARTLAGYKVPRALVLVDEVARTPAGKADYRWAKERRREGLGATDRGVTKVTSRLATQAVTRTTGVAMSTTRSGPAENVAADPRSAARVSDDVRRQGPPTTSFPPIEPLRPAGGRAERAHRAASTTSASARRARSAARATTPTAERLAAERARSSTASTRRRCARRRAQALLTGRNHHSVGMGGITEIATSAPGYSSVRPNTCAPLAETLQAQRLLDRAVRQVPRGAGVGDEPDGPVRPVADRRRRLRVLLRLHRRRDQPVRTRRSTRARRRSSPTRRPEEGYHFTEDMTDKAIDVGAPAEGADARQAVLHVLRAGRDARAAPRPDGVVGQVQGPVRRTAGTRCARRRSRARRSSASIPATPSSPRATTRSRPGTTCPTSSSRCSRGRWRSTPASSSTPTTTSAG